MKRCCSWPSCDGAGRDARPRLGISIDGEEPSLTEAEAERARAESAEAEVARLRALLAGRG